MEKEPEVFKTNVFIDTIILLIYGLKYHTSLYDSNVAIKSVLLALSSSCELTKKHKEGATAEAIPPQLLLDPLLTLRWGFHYQKNTMTIYNLLGLL